MTLKEKRDYGCCCQYLTNFFRNGLEAQIVIESGLTKIIKSDIYGM